MRKLSRILTAVLVAVMVVYAGVVAYVEESKPVLSPNRFGDATVHDIFCPEGLGLVGRVDAVARVLIGDWLGDSIYHYTLYDAAVLECYSGDLPERIVVRLEGSSQNPITGSPLYTYGNELLLLLSETGAEDMGHNSVYASSQLGFTAFYIGYDDGGTAYAVPCELNRLHHGEDLENRADAVGDEVLSGLIENDPVVWSDRSVETAFLLNDLVARVNEILTANSTKPPEVSLSVDGEVIALEPFSYSWKALRSPNKHRENTLSGTFPLELSDEEWNALPYIKGEPGEVEVLCRVEPQYLNIQAWHESYRGTDDPWNTTLVERKYISDEDGVFETRARGGYVYLLTVGWDSDPTSESPQFKGHADYAFRVGESAEVDADSITLASFDEYPAEQLSNLLADTPRDELRGRFGEPDISSEHSDLWMTDSGKFVSAYYHPGDDSVFYIRSSLGLPSTPQVCVTIDGVSYPVVMGNMSWMYSVDGVVESGLQGCHADLQTRDWSADTIYTDAREASITLDLPERIAERISLTISGPEITADGAEEAFDLYPGTFLYEFTASIREVCDEDERPLFSGTVHCAFRVVVG